MQLSATRLLLILGALTLFAGCSSGSGSQGTLSPPPNDGPEGDPVVLYDGPSANSEDVRNFKLHLWDNIARADRCGSCHMDDGQSPEFARADDINLAYTTTNTYVNLQDPPASRLVTKVASGHGCWSTNLGFCAEKLSEWIAAWAAQSGIELTETALRVPEAQDVSASLTFSDSPSAFEQYVYPLLERHCSDCHRADAPQAPVQPFLASRDLDIAYRAAQTKMLFNASGTGGDLVIDASRARLVVRLREENHNCWGEDCAASAEQMEAALEAFAATMEMRDLDASLVTSKAMRIADGTAISQGGRIETNAIAIYPFKAGSGRLASDYSDGFPPTADLNLIGDVTWVSNWGLRFNNGRAQASVAASRKLHTYITQTGEYSLEAWVVPANVTQEGPARILSYSGSNTARNFTLGQTLYSYNFAARASTTNVDGAPLVNTPGADEILQATLQHVVASYDPVEGRKLYVNGQDVGMPDSVQPGNLNDWDDNFALILGNEASGEYPWSGTIRFLAIHNRALTADQANTNFEVGVGQKILLAFSVAEHIANMSDAYIVFQVEQFDDYSYLFNRPYFFSFTETPSADIPIQGLRIGVNGREVAVGQAYANLDTVIRSADFSADGVPLSSLGTIVQAEKGPEQDQFFLSFDRIGSASFSRAPDILLPPGEPEDLPPQPALGVRNFLEINASLAAMTGIAATDPRIASTYAAVEQQLPAASDIRGFLVAHQMGVTQLAVKYCNVLANDTDRRRAFYPDFDGQFTAPGRDAVIQPLLAALLAHEIPGEGVLNNQPDTATSATYLNGLIDTMTAGCGTSCSSTVINNTLTASCAAALGSAVMLVQ